MRAAWKKNFFFFSAGSMPYLYILFQRVALNRSWWDGACVTRQNNRRRQHHHHHHHHLSGIMAGDKSGPASLWTREGDRDQLFLLLKVVKREKERNRLFTYITGTCPILLNEREKKGDWYTIYSEKSVIHAGFWSNANL